jgi:hypothetical protein
MLEMSNYLERNPLMSHLSTDRLSALADESPTATELAHLASCAECARERAAFQAVVELAAADSARIGSPLTSWETLRPALVADRIIDDGSTVRPAASRNRRGSRPWLQAAAAVLLVLGGAMAGRYSIGASPLPIADSSSVAAASAPADSVPRFHSIDEARVAQLQSQALYQSATAFLAAQDTSIRAVDSPAAIRTRLAALDRATQAIGQALDDAPYDPVINGYYLSTLGLREATLRQLNMVMPASMRITSY